MSILEAPFILETRRNHGLEHATLNILAGRYPNRPLGGHSNPTGFFIIGDLPTQAVREAVSEALARMQNGESHLAMHPHCGTNYIVYGAVAGVLAWLGMGRARKFADRLERLPSIILLSALGFIIAQPLAPLIQQRYTTSGDPGNMSIVDIYPISHGRLTIHRIVTQA